MGQERAVGGSVQAERECCLAVLNSVPWLANDLEAFDNLPG